MTENLEHSWELTITGNTRDPEKATDIRPPDLNLNTISSIFQALEPIRISSLPFYTDIVLQRSDYSRIEVKTRMNIVNFNPELSTKVYVELIYNILKKNLEFKSNVISINMQRKISVFTIIIDLFGYDNLLNPENLQILNDFLSRYHESPPTSQFSIEIFPFPRAQYPNGRKKLSAKNTADSVRNWIQKHIPENGNS